MSKKYIVKKGDNLWTIAKNNGLQLDELLKLNPTKKRLIYPGDELRLEPDKVTKTINIREERERERRLNLDNISAIQGYNHNSNYAIVDKKNKLIQVYNKDNELLYESSGISTGLSGTDYNTITYQGDSGIQNYQGNNSTPAGILTISGKGQYHGLPSLQRSRFNPETGQPYKVHPWIKGKDGKYRQDKTKWVNDDVASSIHYGNTDKTHSSNGCIRADKRTLENLDKYLNVGDNIYTLPEKEGSRFTLKNGRLNFTADNPYGITEKGRLSSNGRDMVNWDDYNIHIDKSYSPLQLKWKKTGNEEYDTNKKKFAQGIVNNKKQLQKQFNLSSDEYNRLAELALGIAEQESKYGTATTYKLKEDNQWLVNVAKKLKSNNSSNSRGYTQIKYGDDIKNKELKQIYDNLGITDESLNDGNKAAIATIARLAFMYNNEVKGRTFRNNYNEVIDPYHALMYKWNGKNKELTNKTATPSKNKYIRNVNNYSRNFDMYETRTYNKYLNGGRLSLSDIY